MQHLDPDRLVTLALGEHTADADESDHLTDCDGCRTEIDDLRHVAGLSAETQDLHELPPPPDRVWQGIAAEVAESRSVPTAPDAVVLQLPQGVRPRAAPRRTTRRWLPPLVSAVAAAVLAVVGTVAVIRVLDRPAPLAVTARAALTPLQGAPASAHGAATVLANQKLDLDIQDLPLTTGFYQVWLIDPDDLTKMVPVGMLGTSTGDVELPIGPTVDLNQFRVVDVSAEANDGNSAHSGKSLLRGTLTS